MTLSTEQLVSCEEQLETSGFCQLHNLLSTKEIEDLRKRFDECEAHVHDTCSKNEPDDYEFVQQFEKEQSIWMKSYCQESIIEVAKVLEN